MKCIVVNNIEQFGGAATGGAHENGGGSGGGAKTPACRLKGLLTYISDVLTKTMLDKLQEIFLGNHEIDILVLQDKILKMHNKWDTIPQYIEVLKDAQQQAKHVKMPIDNATLVMYLMRDMLSTEAFG